MGDAVGFLRVAADEPQEVVVVADWLTYLSAGATVLAAALALFSIYYAARQAKKTRAYADRAAQQARSDAAQAVEQGRLEAAHDRRMQYELSILAEMSRQYGITGTAHLRGYVRALIRSDAPDEDLPVLRQITGVYPNPATTTAGQCRQVLHDTIDKEIEDAISRRLSTSSADD